MESKAGGEEILTWGGSTKFSEPLSDEEMVRVAKALQTDTYLKSLDLKHKREKTDDNDTIGESAAVAIANALRHNNTLTDITFKSVEGGVQFAKEIAISLMHNTSLLRLTLTSCEGIGDEGAKTIAFALLHNTTLTTLRMDQCLIRVEGIKALGYALLHNTTLKGLYLGSGGYGDEGAKVLGYALANNNTIQHVSVSSSKPKITGEGAKGIAYGLEHNTSLRELYLNYNSIGIEGALALLQAMCTNKPLQSTLELLHLYGNYDENDKGIAKAGLLKNLGLSESRYTKNIAYQPKHYPKKTNMWNDKWEEAKKMVSSKRLIDFLNRLPNERQRMMEQVKAEMLTVEKAMTSEELLGMQQVQIKQLEQEKVATKKQEEEKEKEEHNDSNENENKKELNNNDKEKELFVVAEASDPSPGDLGHQQDELEKRWKELILREDAMEKEREQWKEESQRLWLEKKRNMKKREETVLKLMTQRINQIATYGTPWIELETEQVMQFKAEFDKRENSLGQGAFGRVFKGIWEGKEVAIKQMNVTGSVEDMCINLRRELFITAPLASEYLVAPLAAYTQGEPFMILSEFMAEGHLESFLTKHRAELSFSLLLGLAKDMTKGLIHLHEQGIIHRDIKPENILICKDETGQYHAKIADFGTSRFVSFAQTATAVGTPNYFAPEMMDVPIGEKAGDFGRKVDVFSLGAVFYFLCFQNHAFIGWKGIEMRSKGDRPDLTGNGGYCPPAMQEIIHCCWQQDPLRRPSSRKLSLLLESI